MDSPKIRFKGYTDAWEQRKFNDVFDFMQNNSLSRAELSSDAGDVMNVHYGDILVKYGDVLDVETDNLTYLLNSTLVEKYQASLLQNGDIIIADAAEDETVGKCTEIAGLTTEIVLSGLHTIPCRPTTKFAEGYLGYYMNSRAYHDQLLPLIQGTKISSISKSAIQDTKVMYPKLEGEQVKIGSYFTNLDHLITLHQRKCEQTKKLKKFMLQKMFPKDGANVPEIRFSGFTDVWEQRKLGDLGSLKNGMNFSKDAMGHGYAFVNLQNVFGNNVVDAKNLGLAEASEKQLLEYSLQKGDVLFVRSSVKLEGVGEAALVSETLENTTYSGFIIRFRDEYGLNNDFKKFVFATKKVRDQIMSQATNSANKNISQSVLENLTFEIPSKDEQKKIGEFFQNLDNLITLHQRKYEELQKIKKFMLQNLFV